jgi:hypothetical protein
MATVKKAQKGTVMQKLKAKYPNADTTKMGDTRYSETYSGLPSKAKKQQDDTEKAFDKKFGKGKPAMKMGGKIKKAQAGLGVKPSKPVGPIDPNGAWTKVQERTIAGKTAAAPVLKKDKELGATKMKSGGKVKDKNWIQKAVNPKHKGYCTPMTKATCTPKRKALAKTFKAMGRARKGK